jgi:hypothetical protein
MAKDASKLSAVPPGLQKQFIFLPDFVIKFKDSFLEVTILISIGNGEGNGFL